MPRDSWIGLGRIALLLGVVWSTSMGAASQDPDRRPDADAVKRDWGGLTPEQREDHRLHVLATIRYAAGRSIVIDDEAQMDAVTAVSGTGPAYFYLFVEAITAAGERGGLSRQHADILAKQACLGAARMMLESGDPPNVLREKVTSPGGTTQAALESMAANNVFDHICEGVTAAVNRSRELGP